MLYLAPLCVSTRHSLSDVHVTLPKALSSCRNNEAHDVVLKFTYLYLYNSHAIPRNPHRADKPRGNYFTPHRVFPRTVGSRGSSHTRCCGIIVAIFYSGVIDSGAQLHLHPGVPATHTMMGCTGESLSVITNAPLSNPFAGYNVTVDKTG